MDGRVVTVPCAASMPCIGERAPRPRTSCASAMDGVDGARGDRRRSRQSRLGERFAPSILREQGLADEVLLVVYLVVLGTEKAFFAERTATRSFELVSRQAVRCGIVFSTHKVSREL